MSFDSQTFLATVTGHPGVYQMYGAEDNLLYVGKANNLKKRLSSYFRKSGLGPKTKALVSRIVRIELTVTASETEALLLEQSLIKTHQPPYNILLRDDKSYPYIFLSEGEPYPRLAFHRGAKQKKGRYFGPFPNSGAVRESLNFLQKFSRVRQCEDSFFRNRSRPCLQYQIRRCSGPCVGMVTPDQYARDVDITAMFLLGHEQQALEVLATDMEQAAEILAFERAAELRDRIASLRTVQEHQAVDNGVAVNVDVFGCVQQAGAACVQVLFVRQGRVLGSRSYFPALSIEDDAENLLATFIAQFYLGSERELPSEIIAADFPDAERELLQHVLGEKAGRKIAVSSKVRTHRQQWLNMANKAAKENLMQRLANRQNIEERFEALRDVLGLESVPERIECFDISHSSGEATVASCVVFDRQGARKSDYRRFNIDGITGGDDYAAMRQALTRRYRRLKDNEGVFPDILLIDGGKGQLSQAVDVLEELQIGGMLLVGVAKGSTRKAGFEQLFVQGESNGKSTARIPPADSPALHLIQQVRDEAHRFAVAGHTARRDKKRGMSPLEGIAGVGPTRRRALLRHFGGLQEVVRASSDELAKVPGISAELADTIYAALHP
ncbi:MAG: excinuclease ABC subunit UvrC [Pseudomonadales bacterium]|jgi:excinuclease ABC subunit C|nr:excinuclease ABC subunit UvrC [Pseudomonadales bacterium]